MSAADDDHEGGEGATRLEGALQQQKAPPKPRKRAKVDATS